MLGIKEVATEYIINHTKTIITILGKGGRQNLLEILNFEKNEYRKALDLAVYLQKFGYFT